MIGRQAKVFSRRDLRHLRAAAKRSRTPLRDDVVVLLAARAGLRACEIARLTWGMVLDPTGKVAPVIEVRAVISKRGAGRRVPMHRELRRAIRAWQDTLTAEQTAPNAVIVPSLRGGGSMRANSIVNWFVVKCREAGLTGCSSHSGRRTFITNAARRLHFSGASSTRRAGASLRDVQMLAGHRSIETTQGYIDGDSDAQRRLVALI